MADESIAQLVTAFFFGVGVVVSYAIFTWIRGMFDAKHRAQVLEINVQSRSIVDAVDKLNDDDLIKRANDRLNGTGDNSSKE